MSSWRDPETWRRMVSGVDCPICRQMPAWEPVAVLEASLVMTGEEAPMRGYCWLPLRRHAVEPYELEPEEGAAYMRDLQRVARAVHELTGAVKLNYELHGNTVPHLHTHIFPRYVGDPFEGGPITPRAVRQPVYRPGEFTRFEAGLRAALAR